MILLTLLAVGLLNLSAVTLRSTSRGSAREEARANARLALMLAIGELQRYAGPDRAITASSDILDSPSTPVAKPNTTGVWESWWDFNPTSSPNYASEKNNRFRRWLVSSADPGSPLSKDFATAAWTGKTIELVGSGSLGTAATAAEKATAGLVPVSKGGVVKGSYAWHVSDESVKARINLYRDPARNSTLAEKRALLAGHRPDPSLITGLDFLPSDQTPVEFADASSYSGKLINLNQAELLDQAVGKIKPLRNHITPYSLGVLADVRGGGLKQDLSSVFEAAHSGTLPSEFNGKNLYASTHGITGISDPRWSALAGYYNSFRNLTNPETSPTIAVKSAASFADPVPEGYNPLPVIAKVDMIYSLVARPLSNQAAWISRSDGPRMCFDYNLNMLVTPVVTLHNPYNVNVSFHRMQVSFRNIPVAFNFMFQNNGSGPFVSQSVVPGTFEAMNTMLYTNAASFRNDRSFVMTIANWANDNPLPANNTVNGPIVLKPGQTLVCGPTLPATASYDQDTKSGSNALGFDWENDLISNIKAKTAFTPGIGFETNSIAISNFRGNKFTVASRIIPTNNSFHPGAWWGHGFMMLRDASAPNKLPVTSTTSTDRFYVEYKLQRPDWYPNNNDLNMRCAPANFGVTAKLQATASDTMVDYADLRFDYGDGDYLNYTATTKPSSVTTANNILNRTISERVYRYPPTGSLTGSEVAAPAGVTYGAQYSHTHPFAIFSAYSRTTSGGVYETGKRTKSAIDSPEVNLLRDGRLAGKPFLFHNPSRSNFKMDLAAEKPGVQAYELNFQPFLSKGDFQDYMDVDAANRVPSLTGNKTTSGIKSGSYLELPSGPMQTIADFRRSNALTTTYLPHFVQPVGNSLLHPLMSPGKVLESNSAISPTAMLDHSFLANHALYDRFYFSTFATRGGTKPGVVFGQFMDGTAPLATQSFEPYLPIGKNAADAKAELFPSDTPNSETYRTAAEHQMIRGPFNVNSTSVQAWKAMLASMSKTDVATLWAKSGALESVASSGAPITPMSLVNGGSINAPVDGTKIDNPKSNTWNGYRELDATELEKLAVEIVAEVRARGPFLSMSEFVNRRIGPSSPLTLSGALEAAIAKAEINEKQNAAFPTSFLEQVPITPTDISDSKLYSYTTPEASTGNPAAGAPGWVTQGDLLRILEPSATVRGDTFVIRTYGEAVDANGKVTATAYAEAVIQRVPEYVDPVDRPSTNVDSANPANQVFGRRMNIVSFRWLSDNEI